MSRTTIACNTCGSVVYPHVCAVPCAPAEAAGSVTANIVTGSQPCRIDDVIRDEAVRNLRDDLCDLAAVERLTKQLRDIPEHGWWVHTQDEGEPCAVCNEAASALSALASAYRQAVQQRDRARQALYDEAPQAARERDEAQAALSEAQGLLAQVVAKYERWVDAMAEGRDDEAIYKADSEVSDAVDAARTFLGPDTEAARRAAILDEAVKAYEAALKNERPSEASPSESHADQRQGGGM